MYHEVTSINYRCCFFFSTFVIFTATKILIIRPSVQKGQMDGVQLLAVDEDEREEGKKKEKVFSTAVM